jgi:hypothetical protein
MGRRRKEEQTVFRLESYQIGKIRQNEMLRDAERARLAARINHKERKASGRRIDLRLQALRPLIAFRQAL